MPRRKRKADSDSGSASEEVPKGKVLPNPKRRLPCCAPLSTGLRCNELAYGINCQGHAVPYKQLRNFAFIQKASKKYSNNSTSGVVECPARTELVELGGCLNLLGISHFTATLEATHDYVSMSWAKSVLCVGNKTFDTLRHCKHLHQIENLEEKYQVFKCPAALADYTQCTNTVNPQAGFCDYHVRNVDSRLSEKTSVSEHIHHLFLAIEYPDDQVLVDNALSTAAALHRRCRENQQTGYAMRECYQNADLRGLAEAEERTWMVRRQAQREAERAEAQCEKVLALPPVPVSNSIASNTTLMQRMAARRAANFALPPGSAAPLALPPGSAAPLALMPPPTPDKQS